VIGLHGRLVVRGSWFIDGSVKQRELPPRFDLRPPAAALEDPVLVRPGEPALSERDGSELATARTN
jgi:hypothetical protein